MTEGVGGFGGGGLKTEKTQSNGVFISHATEDALLANAFCELIQDVTAGMIPAYSSSSTSLDIGIPYGDDWFAWIQEKIRTSRHIVALITPTSVGRPWILFEAGLGKASEHSKVFGLRLGISAEEAYIGPFKAFQNSGSTIEELAKLCSQLLAGTQCQPRSETVRQFVEQFEEKVTAYLAGSQDIQSKTTPESEAFFAALEDMKSLVSSSHYSLAMQLNKSRRVDLFEVFELCDRGEFDASTPGLELAILIGICNETGFKWLVPALQYALENRIDFDAFARVLEVARRTNPGDLMPTDLFLNTALKVVTRYQQRKFGDKNRKKPHS